MSRLPYSLSKYDIAIGRLIEEILSGLLRVHPILGQIQTIPVAHGGTTRQISEPQVLETDMKLYKAGFSLELDSFRKTDVNSFAELLFEMHESFSTQLMTGLFEAVSKTTEITGNQIDARGRNIWDATLETVRTMRMNFDENGNHNYQFYVHPDTYKRLMENPPTPEQQRQMDELIEAKRAEYYAQKRARRLS